MKFSNGCWLQKKGTACHSPAEVYFTSVEEKKVLLYAPTSHIAHRGDTLGGVCLTIEITSPMPEIIRVKAFHNKGVPDNGPKFELSPGEGCSLDVKESEDTIEIHSGKAGLLINKKNWRMTYLNGEETRCSSGARDLAYMKTDWNGEAYVSSYDTDAFMRQQLSLGVGELVYGMGERFGALVKNGQSVDIWNEDGGTSTEQSYKNIPFYVTNKGYGIFVNHTEKVSFEVASEAVTKVEFSVPGERLDYFYINGPEMKDVLRRYTDLTGKPGLPAPWTFGLWLSTSFTTNYDEKTVMSFIDGMSDRGIPLKVFHFDCFWMKDFHWSDFTWDSRVFPDPRGMLSRIKAKGLRICVWINSYIAQCSPLFDEAMEKGYLLKRPDGSVWQWDMWQPGMAIVDFTNPGACRWYQDKLEALLDMGVDCFKTDFGERIPTDAVYFDGSDPVKMHNYYTYLYNKTVYELLERKRGKDEAVLFARSATVGGQKFPVHWGGDCWSDYESMEESLRGGLSLQMSGFGFWSHDIGGFESTSTPDVYKRWCAFGLLSSHSRLHGSSSYRVPWLYDEESVDVVRFFVRLKAKLMPYLWKTALAAHREGIPSMRAMVLEFTEDKNCAYLDKQYMLGDSLLVAPVFNNQSIGEYYLPKTKGLWTNFFTGEEQESGQWYERTCGYCDIPLMVRPNSIIALGAKDDGPEYAYEENTLLKVFGLTDSARTSVHTMDQKLALTVSAERTGKEVHILLDNKCANNPVIELMNMDIVSAKGASVEKKEHSVVLTACRKEICCMMR
ncbi:MAG: alpha-xylosidase [Butyrivibrio sp.]